MEQISNILAVLEAATADPASPLYFTPVAVRTRRDGWSPERQRRYVAALALDGRVDRAAARVGLSQQSAGRLRLRPDGESFGLACSAAITLAKRARHARRAARAESSSGSAFSVRRVPNFLNAMKLPPNLRRPFPDRSPGSQEVL